MSASTWLSVGLVLLVCVPLSACSDRTPGTDTGSTAADASAPATVYEVRGRLVEVRDGGRTAIIAHETIPGFMDAMTMPFTVREPSELDGLDPGDAISFRLEVAGPSLWISRISRLTDGGQSGEPIEPVTYAEPSAASLYGLTGRWMNQDGSARRLDDFEGNPVVLSMVFTHCSYACPLIVRDMKRIGAELPDDVRDRARFVLVSLDPERDTPEALRRFAEAHALDLDRWTLLRGEEEQVRLLATLLGVRYRQQADGQFAHTSLISILDEEGEIVQQQKGLSG